MSVVPSVRFVRQVAWRAGVSVSRTAARPTAQSRPLPDYLIIGGQRCGTTSLHHYLIQHPGILSARFTKGVHWFDMSFDKPESWYRANFPTAARRRAAADGLGYPVLTGEASPYYLFHPEVPGRVGEVKPDIKIIAILRDPTERAWSHYHHEVVRGFEPLEFEAALDAEEGRLAGAEDTLAQRHGRHFSHQHHGYVARGRYAEQLKRWEHHIPATQTLVLFSTDLQDDTEATMHRVHRFLGLPEHPTTTDRRWNTQSNPELVRARPLAAAGCVRRQ